MDGYKKFQQIIAEMNYKARHLDDPSIKDDDILNNLRNIFGI